MNFNPRYLTVPAFLIICFTHLLAQGNAIPDIKNFKPEFRRQLNHDYIDKEQQVILNSDGRADRLFSSSNKEEINYLVTRTLVTKVDWIQCKIEKDSILDHRLKVYYLHGLENILKYFRSNWISRAISPSSLPAIMTAYENCVQKNKEGASIENIIDGLSYEAGYAIIKSEIFETNPGYITSKYILINKYCALYPKRTFQKLRENPDVPFLDSLIRIAGYKYPKQLYDYASANNKLGYAIRRIDDSLIKVVSKMATSKGSGQLYFPFLDNIVKGRMTFADIDAVKNDDVKYYQLLVKTHIDYVIRTIDKDTAYEFASLNEMLAKKARNVFVNEINGLHNESDAVRFRILQPLNAQELYYLAVSSDGIIYTSSYTRGVYPLMMSKISRRGDSLLLSVKFDKYRKFIKMAAGYNTLSDFLSSFPNQDDAGKLMQAFVGGLEKSDSLEDGVDVADSYASIAETIKPLADEMLKNVKINYETNLSQNNLRGIVMYNLLYKLFLSADSSNNIDLSKELGIPPVYGVEYKLLAINEGKVVMQVFFYGDQDGQNIFQGFLRQFGNANWKLTQTEKWVSITSTKGKPVWIFANRPLPEETGEDAQAQEALNEYLKKNDLKPTVVIHRGHSYYAPYTIEQILPSARIVFMGSCGGYHLIHDILENAPDAHIIASKQIGKTRINQPFFNLLTEKLRTGQNIDWIPFWKVLNKSVTVEGLEDYIPPHKNLGAIFIKAYKIAMENSEQN